VREVQLHNSVDESRCGHMEGSLALLARDIRRHRDGHRRRLIMLGLIRRGRSKLSCAAVNSHEVPQTMMPLNHKCFDH